MATTKDCVLLVLTLGSCVSRFTFKEWTFDQLIIDDEVADELEHKKLIRR